ncbi:tetratricopeptide repeat protein [Candidatus Thorarchaeota archaeon]|nr:MAG: tetratricopeptide repeat protein [Candidatus Thorarchaeota archaeon]
MFENWTITKKVTRGLSASVVIAAILIASYMVTSVYFMSDQNTKDAAAALTEEELANLERITSDTADFIEERIQQYFDGVYMMEEYAENLFNGRYDAAPQHSYFWDPVLEEATTGYAVPNLQSIEEYESDSISFEVSCYYLPRDYYIGGDPFQWDADMEYVLETSSNMDNVFRALHQMSPDYIWLYMGFDLSVSDNHLFKNYPYDNLEYFLDWYEPGDYDPNIEEWYTNAASIENDTIAVTNPYGDPSTGLVLSMGRPIRFDNDSLIGVVSADVTLDTINTEVLAQSVSENGYAFLVDETGGLVAHPGFESEGQTIYDAEFGSESSSEAIAFQSIFSDILSTSSGQVEYTKNGQKWYLTFEEVPTTGMVLCTVTPESDVVSAATALLATITFQTYVIIGALVVAVGAVIYFSSKYANERGEEMARPLSQATDVLLNMSRGDLSGIVPVRDLRYKELQTTMGAIQNLQDSMRAGNKEFIRGNLSLALETYIRLRQLCVDFDVIEGIQAAELNIGNVHRQKGEISQARERYTSALQMAEKILRDADTPLEEKDAQVRIADVKHNFGVLEMSPKLENYDEALDYLQDALAINDDLGNKRGMANQYDTIGVCKMALGDLQEAREMFDKALSILDETFYERSKSYVHYHRGKMYYEMEMYDDARADLTEAANISQENEEWPLAGRALSLLADVLEDMGEPSHEVRTQAEKIMGSAVRRPLRRAIEFVIDKSGSMGQSGRIQAAVAGAQRMVESVAQPQDSVGVVAFDTRVTELRPLKTLGQDTREAKRQISHALRLGGSTAFFDALGMALERIAQEPDAERWVISLTDGEDNSSDEYDQDSIVRLANRLGVDIKLRLIGVLCSSEYEQILQDMCDRIEGAKYLPVSEAGTEGEGILQKFEGIEDEMQAQLELGGTEVDF